MRQLRLFVFFYREAFSPVGSLKNQRKQKAKRQKTKEGYRKIVEKSGRGTVFLPER